MSNLVIVAIPDENDRVWKISSEKVPHLTLLFLGEIDQVQNPNQIVDFVGHAANITLNRFHLMVDRRGELGDDKADVLFFKKDPYSYKAIRDFRAALLQDNNIKKAYDSATQFEGPWNPHLTLGYSATPAKPEDDDWGSFYSVDFNKISVWVDDYEGPEFLLKDYWDEYETLDAIPMDVAMSSMNSARVVSGMSALTHAETVSEKKWSEFKNSDYTDEQYAKACLLDRGQDAGTAKQRYSLPVREPDGTLNRAGCHAAAAVLSSAGGTGSARGNKLNATDEQINKAKNKLVALYKGPLEEDIPEGLGGGDSVKQAAERGVAFLEHYGVKGQRWGVRKDPRTGLTKGEIKREGIQRYLDPQGHALSTDVAKFGIGYLVPVVAPLTWPAQIRMVRGGARGVQKKALDSQEKRFAKNAMSPKNFVAIHNGAVDKMNRDLVPINAKYPKPNQDAKTQKKYDDEVLASMQGAYRESANSIGNRARTQHLDIEFKNDGLDFKIHAREGAPTPQPKRVRHAVEDDLENEEITVEITGKIKRDAAGHIVGFEFDDLKPVQNSMAQSVIETGTAFVLEHYGVKGMRWGVRRQGAVTTQTHIDTGLARRRTQVQAKGGESHPAHEDAINAAIQRRKLKKSGTAALSNKELRELASRIQLETQVSILTSSKGRRFVQQQIEQEGKEQFKKGAARAAPQVVRRVRRGAAAGAAAAALV